MGTRAGSIRGPTDAVNGYGHQVRPAVSGSRSTGRLQPFPPRALTFFGDGLPSHSRAPHAAASFRNLPGALLQATRSCSGCVTQGTRCSLYLCQSDRRYPRAPVVEAGAPPGVHRSAPLRFRMSHRAAIPVQSVDLCAERGGRGEEVTHEWTSAKDTSSLPA